MIASDGSASPVQLQAPATRNIRTLTIGSVTEIAEWLLGTIGRADKDDFGALAGTVFAGGALWRCGPDSVWRQFGSAELYALVSRFDGAVYLTPEGKRRCVQVSADFSRRVLRTLEEHCDRPDFFSRAPHGLAFRNGFLRIASDGGCRLEDLTPEHHVTRMLPFNYEPVPAPESFAAWKAFLASIWGASGPDGGPDLQSIQLVHQMIGYLLSGSNDHQKMFLLLGPSRSGKGTICKLLLRLFGPDGGAFKLAGLDNNFALEGMLGKSLCVDGDVRRSKGASRDEGKIVERLLGITASDAQEIPRKNKTALHLTLPTRLVLASNPPFSVRDVGSALASRIITVPFPVSFLGQEQLDLEERLAAELPAIVALAMQSMRALRAQGRFIEPESAAELREEIERGQTPLREFFDEWCAFAADARTGCGELYRAVRQWAEENGNAAPSNQSFASALKQLGVRRVRPNPSDGKRPNAHYEGVRLLEAPTAAVGTASAARALRAPANGIASVTPLRPKPS